MKRTFNRPLVSMSADLRCGVLAGRSGSAFTLVEMLVAIGAVALVSVGLAAIFQTVGKTVTTGKRVSQLTQQAAILESQMREDFAKMTRDGFLVIRHQFTIDGGTPRVVAAPRFKGDPVPMRPRRIDEIMFFATGDFRGSREQMIPGKSTNARSARIYYGHGQLGVPMAPNQTDAYYDYFNPAFDNRLFFGFRATGNAPDARLSQNRLGGMIPESNYAVPGVNYYASDWTLLRHATLLQKPGTSPGGGWPENVPAPAIAGTDSYANSAAKLDQLSGDNNFQIAGQPAAPSIFRSISEMLVMNYGGDSSTRNFAFFWPTTKNPNWNALSVPRFVSGLVETATTDLDEISLIVNGMGSEQMETQGDTIFSVRDSKNSVFVPPMPKILGPLPSLSPYTLNQNPGGSASNTNTTLRRYFEPQAKTNIQAKQPLMLMQSWMLDAMPNTGGYYPTISSGFETGGDLGPKSVAYQIGARIRYDNKTPDLRGTLDFYSGRDAIVRRTDLLSLGLSRVAAHCTEFIVEWSWGQTYPVGTKDEQNRDIAHQVVWYGRTLQPYTSSGVPILNRIDGRPSPDVYHYEYRSDDTSYRFPGMNGLFPRPVPDSPQYQPFANDEAQSQTTKDYVVNPALVHGGRKRKSNDNSSLISYFGYFDPMFVPTDTSIDPPSMPWPWPKMIRATITLADANDPSVEQTFQYVFDLPPDPKP